MNQNRREALTAHNAKTLPDGGADGQGRRKQKCYTDKNGMQLMVCGNSRLYYSPWEVPPHLLKAGREGKRSFKREALGSADDTSATALAEHLKIRENITRRHLSARRLDQGRRPPNRTGRAFKPMRRRASQCGRRRARTRRTPRA